MKSTSGKDQLSNSSALTLLLKEVLATVPTSGFNAIRLFKTRFEGPHKEISTDFGGRVL